MIKYILLDIHGVLTDGTERKNFISLMEKMYGVDPIKHNLLLTLHVDKLDKNSEKGSEYIQIFNEKFNTDISLREYFDLFRQQIKVNTDLMHKLGTFDRLKIRIVSDNFSGLCTGFNTLFGSTFKKYKKFYSFRLKTTKAEGALAMVIKKLKVRPEECLFIDDNEKNISVAKKLHINPLLFKTNEELFLEIDDYLS